MAKLNAKWTSVLSRLSQEVQDNVYTKLKPINDITSKDSPLWLTFARFRQHGKQAVESGIPSGWEDSKDALHLASILYLIRLRRQWELWDGHEIHDLIGQINWGISNGAGEDLLDFISQAKATPDPIDSIGTQLDLLRLERIVTITYADSGDDRIERLGVIMKERSILLERCKSGQAKRAELDKKWNRKEHRVKSDLLFRLSKTLDVSEFDLLRDHMRLHTKNGKQFRLLEYYRNLEVWSKQREQLDWKGEKLAQLKNRTLLWLMRRMGMLGNWQGAEVHGWIGDIRWCISKEINPDSLGIFELAENKAMEEESYESLITLSDLRAFCKSRFLDFADGGSTKGMEALLERLLEIEEMYKFRFEHFEPIKRVNAATGINLASKWESLFNELELINKDALMTSEARKEFTLLQMLAANILNDHQLAISFGQSILKMNATKKHLPGISWRRYFKELWTVSYVFSMGGRHDLAKAVIEEMEQVGKKSPNLLIQSIMLKLMAYSNLYHGNGDQSSAEQALIHFRESRRFLSYDGEGKNLVWLHFFIAEVSLELGQYQEALGSLNLILDHKANTSTIILAHSRLMLLLCHLGLRTEVEVVFDASTACSMYIHRQKGLPKHLHAFAKAIKRIAQFEYGTIDQATSFTLAIEQAQVALVESGGNQSISPPYCAILQRLMALIIDCR
jgi:tetratricopeptide (TPR) repeat protein